MTIISKSHWPTFIYVENNSTGNCLKHTIDCFSLSSVDCFFFLGKSSAWDSLFKFCKIGCACILLCLNQDWRIVDVSLNFKVILNRNRYPRICRVYFFKQNILNNLNWYLHYKRVVENVRGQSRLCQF